MTSEFDSNEEDPLESIWVRYLFIDFNLDEWFTTAINLSLVKKVRVGIKLQVRMGGKPIKRIIHLRQSG